METFKAGYFLDCIHITFFNDFYSVYIFFNSVFHIYLAFTELKLDIADIEDPHVTINIDNLSKYKIGHLKGWLMYRGDSLRGIHTVKDAQLR